MDDPQKVIDEIVKTEPKIHVKNPLMEGSFDSIMRKLTRMRKQQLHDSNLRTNNLFCRKRCKLFKKCECFKKTFEEQRKCEQEKTYIKLQEELDKKQ